MKLGSSTRFSRAPMTLVVCSSSCVVIASPHSRLVDGLDDVLVAGAAAEVALEPAPDLGIGQAVTVRAEQLDGAHDHPRRAETALERVPLPERLLQRMQLAVVGKPFDRRHLGAVRLNGEHGAGLHCVAVEVDRAGTANG